MKCFDTLEAWQVWKLGERKVARPVVAIQYRLLAVEGNVAMD